MSGNPISPPPVSCPDGLPVEVIGIIIGHLIAQIPTPPLVALTGTLLAKRYQIPGVSNCAFNRLLDMWTSRFVTPSLPPLRNLCLNGIWYTMPLTVSLAGVVSTCTPYPYAWSILPEGAASIIAICAWSLVHLKLRYVNVVGFSTVLTNAIQGVTNLKTLVIHGSQSPHTMHDYNTLKTLLEGMISLESLSIRFADLPSMRLRPGSLPNLTHFYISCHPRNCRAAIDICRPNKRPINCLEIFPPSHPDPTAAMVLGLTATLETLFIMSIPDRVPHDIRNHIFPHLRVLRSKYCNSEEEDLRWLNPELPQPFTPPPNLKHIVSTITPDEETPDLYLVNAFEAIVIQCHFMNPMTRDEIATLPDQLNAED
ncbi:uncharacterized protein MELLADRAFT_61529 [Melampsora larici-populina 98AG31]|uniref:Uncharacterized protein n=1 Tax=Melampsora larici-populina (strain 98AG31 / pathotype 3-4-7) TaxID=747676 RepID=F4RF98_MELLP|nr:uncharacterized protein MELLADRAFT_61529 [Melampsora larici-populina 98AG31]EGG08776.1 hypothetical protein MELLADRAFT_61529 [Melampsora larici-populina 98AG31]